MNARSPILYRLLALGLIIAALLVAASVLASSAGPAVDWWIVSGGGGSAPGGNVTLNATLGQPIVGASAGNDITLNAGYWYGGAATPQYRIYLPVVQRSPSGQ